MNKKKLYKKRLNCPICQSADLSVIYSIQTKTPEFTKFLKLEKFYSENFYKLIQNGLLKEVVFEIVKCNKCNFIFQSNVLNDEGMFLLYNHWLDKELLLKYYSEMKPNEYEKALLKVIKKVFKKENNINILDYGAGYGNFCALSKKLGFNTFAFDLSNDKNEYIISDIGVNKISNLNDYELFFDFIFVNQVFEHVSDPLNILKKLKNSLSHKGIIYISVPDCNRIEETIKNNGLTEELFMQLSPQQHINAFNNKTLLKLGYEAGLRQLNIFDFLNLYRTSLSKKEITLLIKLGIKSLLIKGTSLFFYKDEKK